MRTYSHRALTPHSLQTLRHSDLHTGSTHKQAPVSCISKRHLKELSFKCNDNGQVHTLGSASWWLDWMDPSLEIFSPLSLLIDYP